MPRGSIGALTNNTGSVMAAFAIAATPESYTPLAHEVGGCDGWCVMRNVRLTAWAKLGAIERVKKK